MQVLVLVQVLRQRLWPLQVQVQVLVQVLRQRLWPLQALLLLSPTLVPPHHQAGVLPSVFLWERDLLRDARRLQQFVSLQRSQIQVCLQQTLSQILRVHSQF
jgi:hypothetical protein